jgi:glutamate synthase domain-containing protein 2
MLIRGNIEGSDVMLNQLILKLMDPMLDETMVEMLTREYADNPLMLATVAEKLSTRAIIEAGMRAESGKALERPLGSPIVLAPWHQILLNSKQLFALPTNDPKKIQTTTVIGPNAKKPLVLDMPIMITGMSYGGSISLPLKMAIAKGTAMVGTSTNTGESSVTDEERDNAKFLIGQYNRGGRLTSPEQLKLVDAIEIQFGQGAFGGAAYQTTKAKVMDDHLRGAWNLEEGQDSVIYPRFPNVNSQQDIINLVKGLKNAYDVPVGIKIAASDYIENELEVIAQTQADFIAIDGFEGGTSGAPPTLADNVGLPSLYALVRAVDWLTNHDCKEKFSLIIAGGLATPGHFLKAIALGADAVYIGSIALMATLQTQMTKALPQHPPPQLALYTGKLKDELDIDEAARSLANFLRSCVSEMKKTVQVTGKHAIKELDRTDLVTVNKDLSDFVGIRYAGSHRET